MVQMLDEPSMMCAVKQLAKSTFTPDRGEPDAVAVVLGQEGKVEFAGVPALADGGICFSILIRIGHGLPRPGTSAAASAGNQMTMVGSTFWISQTRSESPPTLLRNWNQPRLDSASVNAPPHRLVSALVRESRPIGRSGLLLPVTGNGGAACLPGLTCLRVLVRLVLSQPRCRRPWPP